MTTSLITLANLRADTSFGQVALLYEINNPHMGCVYGSDLDVVEVRAANVGDFNAATKIQDIKAPHARWVLPGLNAEQPWYFWARARNQAGLFGDWYPNESLAGVTVPAAANPVWLSHTFGNNGWYELPNGIVEQWGVFTLFLGGSHQVVYPRPFETECFSFTPIVLLPGEPVTTTALWSLAAIKGVESSYVYARVATDGGTVEDTSALVQWRANGR